MEERLYEYTCYCPLYYLEASGKFQAMAALFRGKNPQYQFNRTLGVPHNRASP
jgi:hypothetical protein